MKPFAEFTSENQTEVTEEHTIMGGVPGKAGTKVHAVFDSQKRKVGNIVSHPNGKWTRHGYVTKTEYDSSHEAAKALRPNK